MSVIQKTVSNWKDPFNFFPTKKQTNNEFADILQNHRVVSGLGEDGGKKQPCGQHLGRACD